LGYIIDTGMYIGIYIYIEWASARCRRPPSIWGALWGERERERERETEREREREREG